ncbi:MAG: c-type cytochrome biogenesis protein CcsB [Actinobacteria bacterium]|nr:c-type cytochrome biogenesis protein CcsB [Actinomycetota bacterium]
MPPVNVGLAQLSDHFLLATVFFYALAVLAFAGDFAYGRRTAPRVADKQADAEAVAEIPAGAERAHVAVGAGVAAQAGSSGPVSGASTGTTNSAATPSEPPAPGDGQAVAASRWRMGGAPAGPWVRAALALTVIGLVTQILGIATRGIAEHRVPWGNMYEFVMAITCAAVIAFLLLLIRFRVYPVGLFLMAPIVLALGLCATVLYTAAGPLVPALHSYWIWIHVTTMTVAIGSYIVAAVLTVLYLIADRYTGRKGAGFGAVLQRLPPAGALDRLSYRTVIFAFPIWTFAVIAGAIWADQAWGRYWGWDPKETWAFITWVVYAGYLHARATAGWRGRKAAYIQLVGFVSLVFNLIGVNLWITGLHSYAGIN